MTTNILTSRSDNFQKAVFHRKMSGEHTNRSTTMSWETVQAISSIIGTIAVTLTVVYLAIQVKGNTKATYSQTYQFATQALGDMATIAGETKEKARLFSVGMADPSKLDEGEYLQFAYLGISLFRRYENVFFQYQSGMIDDDF